MPAFAAAQVLAAVEYLSSELDRAIKRTEHVALFAYGFGELRKDAFQNAAGHVLQAVRFVTDPDVTGASYQLRDRDAFMGGVSTYPPALPMQRSTQVNRTFLVATGAPSTEAARTTTQFACSLLPHDAPAARATWYFCREVAFYPTRPHEATLQRLTKCELFRSLAAGVDGGSIASASSS
jgi:hypothetical protein